MDISKNRLEAFSDAVIAIIITIMVLDIPVPKDFTFESIRDMGVSFFIYFVSFIVVGAQWVKHHYLFNFCKMVSSKVVWRNILYLFFLSQIPYFSRLLIEHPRKVIPAIFYDIIFLLMMLSYHFLQHGVIESMLKENNKAIIDKINERRDSQKHQTLFILVFLIFFCLIICLSIYNPTISIVFFVIMPIISSLTYLWSDDRFDRKKGNKRINR
nr:TMEM175 family protein [uncultured Terrisporobacter sp.]